MAKDKARKVKNMNTGVWEYIKLRANKRKITIADQLKEWAIDDAKKNKMEKQLDMLLEIYDNENLEDTEEDD